MNAFVEILGWTGAVLVLAAYGLLSTGRIDARSRFFHSLNVLGAAGFVVNSGWYGAYPSATLNVIWMGIGIYALVTQRRGGAAR
jgi:hypothetical protein